jgi:fructose-1,6-bisphosphatase/inositol monophosphatase family enzyme
VLVEEAGGRATSLAGQKTIYAGSLVSTNGPLHAAVLEALATPG